MKTLRHTMKIQRLNRKQALKTVQEKIIKTDTVLDIGCGIRPQTYVHASRHVCIEPYKPYIERLRKEINDDKRFVILNCQWSVGTSLFSDKSFDTVFILDMIEHIEKSEGYQLIWEAERLASKQIVVFTPYGFMPQSHTDRLDHWGMNGGLWQTHRSGWTPEDFGDDWDFIVCEDFHKEDQRGPLKKPFGAFWAIRTFDGAHVKKAEAIPERKRLRFNFGIARNMLLRSLFLMNIYNVCMVAYMFVKQAKPSIWFLLVWLIFPVWWIIDYFVIWRQEVDANFLASKVWKRHEEKLDEIKNELSRLSKTT